MGLAMWGNAYRAIGWLSSASSTLVLFYSLWLSLATRTTLYACGVADTQQS